MREITTREEAGLQRLAGRAHEVAEDSHIGAVSSDAAGVHREAEAFGEIQIHAGIVEFRKAEAGGRLHAIEARGIHGPRRTVTLPRPARQFVKLLPIAFVPSVHRALQSAVLNWMLSSGSGFPSDGLCRAPQFGSASTFSYSASQEK